METDISVSFELSGEAASVPSRMEHKLLRRLVRLDDGEGRSRGGKVDRLGVSGRHGVAWNRGGLGKAKARC